MKTDSYQWFAACNCMSRSLFLMSSNVFDSLRSSYVNTNPLNPSDHRDISAWINTTVISRNTAEYQGSFKNKVAWHKVTEDDINEYKKYMDDLTDNIHIDPNFSVWMILFVMTLIIIFVLNIYVSNWLPTTVPNSRPSRHMMREPESTLLLTTLKSTTSPSDWEIWGVLSWRSNPVPLDLTGSTITCWNTSPRTH